MRALATVTLLALVFASATAQPQVKMPVVVHDLEYLGVPAELALPAFAKSAKLELDLGREAPAMDMPIWLSAKQVEKSRAVHLLSVASGLSVRIAGRRLVVREYDQPGAHRISKGYDVSVLCGRFVDYVNQYGEPERKLSPGQERRKTTAADHLSGVLYQLLDDVTGSAEDSSVVGDRLIFSADAETQALVAEALKLLVQPDGGDSVYLQAAAQQASALRDKQGKTEASERPLASVLAEMCKGAGVDFLINAGFAVDAHDTHVDCSLEGAYQDQVNAVLELFAPDAASGFGHGVVHFGFPDSVRRGGVRVHDVSELLKKMDAAYQRQRTQPNREEGFDGGLREQGGVYVVTDAITAQLGQQGHEARVLAYGVRVIIVGGPAACDAATAILKELGWEPHTE